jgi:branched-chain amino acid transport system permease protein
MSDQKDTKGVDGQGDAGGGARARLNPLAGALVKDGSTRPQKILLAVLLAIAMILPLVIGSNRWITLMTVVVIYVVLASGLNIVVGFTGLLDLGYVAFYAIGAYYTAIIFNQVLKVKYGVDIDAYWWLTWINLLVGGLLAALAGVLIGYPTLRVRGDYLAIMTLAFGEIIRIVANNWVGLTRGPSGISGIPAPAFFGFEFTTQQSLYYLGLGLALISLWTISRIVRSRIGRVWTAIREDEIAAEAMGIHTSRYKLLSYATGAFFAGVMGVFFGHYLNYISPSSFMLMESFLILSLVVLGGMGNIVGPILGATIWIGLQEWLRDFPFVQAHPEVRGIALGLILVLLMVFRPQGLLGSVRVALEMRPGSRTEGEHERQEWSDAAH